ncbi:hypothetical protein [Bradyrhizobium sp. BR 1432]|uniref:hypothetical protein n=1 Tax=Bradyrhizobium sp. BR 1432 TaxID=3447966 RepID=UPI003EE6A975
MAAAQRSIAESGSEEPDAFEGWPKQSDTSFTLASLNTFINGGGTELDNNIVERSTLASSSVATTRCSPDSTVAPKIRPSQSSRDFVNDVDLRS